MWREGVSVHGVLECDADEREGEDDDEDDIPHLTTWVMPMDGGERW